MSPIRVSKDLKLRAYVLVSTGLYSASSAAILLGVSERSIRRWVANVRRRGEVQTPLLFRGRPSKLDTAVLKELYVLVKSHPSLYLDEISAWLAAYHGLDVSLSTLHRALERLGLTRKKLRRTAIQRDELTRTQCIHDITSRFTADQLVFADESSKDDRTCQRLYGRAPSGRRACEARTFARGVRYSILPALSLEGILTVRVVRGSVDGLEFYDWVVSDLVSLFFVCFSSESLPFPSESLPFPTQTC